MTGTVNTTRELWDDPSFQESEMSQRGAWIWLIAKASWKPRVTRIGNRKIPLGRAQVAAATRYLAKAWCWSEPKVRRYLSKLENRRMISRVTDAGVTVITICKHEKYQNKPRDGDSVSTQQPTQDRRTADANENKGEIKIKEEEGARAREAEFLISVREAVGIDPADIPRFWIGPQAAEHLERWKAMGLTKAEIIAEAKASRGKNLEPPDGPKAPRSVDGAGREGQGRRICPGPGGAEGAGPARNPHAAREAPAILR